MRVSVLIPAHNAARTIGLCLDALAQQSRPPDEVVVVDNASTDGTAQVASGFRGRLPGLRVVMGGRLGEPVARNRSLEEATGEVLAFTDADCVPQADWLQNAVRALWEWPDCAAVAGRVVGHQPRRLTERYLSVTAFPTPCAPAVWEGVGLPPPTFYTANLVIRRAALERVGAFDPTLATGCDVDLCVRLLRTGYRVLYDPRLVVAHMQRDTLPKAMRRLFQYGVGVPSWFRKWAESGVWLTAPGGRAVRLPAPWPGWVNVGTPDRILLALAAACAWQPWVGILVLVYLGRLTGKLRALARERGVRVSFWELPLLTAFHVAEFVVFTAGSVSGSMRHRVLCVV